MSRHWFLTGASSGIGRHLAEIILASGDDLTATVRRPETLDDLAARYGDQLVVERLDVTVKGDIAPVVQRAEARRPVDVLVNNAGGGIIGATEEFSDADIEGQISLNLLAPVHVTRATDDLDEARAWFDSFEGAGLDGVVAKRTDAPYAPGQRTMMKIKHARTAEAVVIGYGLSKGASPGSGARTSVGSIHLGLYDDGELLPVGGIGAWPDAVRVQLAAVLEPLVLTGAEADAAPRPKDMTRTGVREFVPVRPELVVEVAFDQLEGRRFRHAAQFVRWRPDREPESCTLDQVERAPAYDLDGVLRP